MAPILITGATGNVGSAVVDALTQAGVPVRAAAGSATSLRGLGDRASLSLRGIEPVVLDFTDPTAWAAYDGVEQVFLMRPPHLSRPRHQMVPSLEAAKAAGVRQVVFLSLQGADANRFVPHAALESWLRSSGLDWTFVRASFFMQNLTTTHLTDIRDRDEIVPAGDGATAFVDAFDVGATIQYAEPGPLRYAAHARRALGMPWAMVGVTTAIYTVARLGRAGSLTEDVHLVTGRRPRTFVEFASSNADVWRR